MNACLINVTHYHAFGFREAVGKRPALPTNIALHFKPDGMIEAEGSGGLKGKISGRTKNNSVTSFATTSE